MGSDMDSRMESYMSERHDFGSLQHVVSMALQTYRRWATLRPIEKAEVLTLLQAIVNIELAREQRSTLQGGSAAYVPQDFAQEGSA